MSGNEAGFFQIYEWICESTTFLNVSKKKHLLYYLTASLPGNESVSSFVCSVDLWPDSHRFFCQSDGFQDGMSKPATWES